MNKISLYRERLEGKFHLKVPKLESFENFRLNSNLSKFILSWLVLVCIFEFYLVFSFYFLNGSFNDLLEPIIFIIVLGLLYLISFSKFFRLNIYLFILFLFFYMNFQLYIPRDVSAHVFVYLGLGMVIQLLSSYFLSLKQGFFIPLADNIISTIHMLTFNEYSTYGVLGYFQTLLFLDVALLIMNYYYQTGIKQVRTYSHELELEKEKSENALNTKNKFLARMSHELRTPLNIISGSLETIEKIPENMGPEMDTYFIKEKYLHMIQKSNIELTELINNLIIYSEIDRNLIVKFDFFSIDSLLQEIYNFFKVDITEKINFSYELDASDRNIVLRSDVDLLKRIINNLISNSIKYTISGFIKLKAEVTILNDSKASLYLTVHDSGSGFNYAENLNRFSDMAIGKDIEHVVIENKGIGLGLSLVRDLVSTLGGKLLVDSELGKETKIKIIFDLEYLIPSEDISKTIPKVKILVGEDDLANQELLKYILEKYNYIYEICQNGREVIDRYFTNKNYLEFDIILMDIRMPVMDGITAVKAIRDFENKYNIPKIPIIAVTAHALKNELLKTLEAGCNAYITKPYEFKDLKVIIDRYSKKQV